MEESELSDWLEVFSEFLPTFDVFVHTYSVCVCVAIGKRKRGFGERWSLEEMKRPWDWKLRCGAGAKGGRLTTVGR